MLAVPFVWLGTAVAQGVVSQVFGGASAGVLYLALRAYGAPRIVAIAGALLSAFGTTLLFTSADGRSWFAAHAVAMLFTAVAFLVAARGGPAWGVGAAIGLAALARLPVAAAAPALPLLVSRPAAALRRDDPLPPHTGVPLHLRRSPGRAALDRRRGGRARGGPRAHPRRHARHRWLRAVRLPLQHRRAAVPHRARAGR